MKGNEICWMSAFDLAKAIAEKELSPVEVVQQFLERIRVINPKINAYITLTNELALRAAKEAESAVVRGKTLGPLHGVPVAIKDTNFTKGIRTTMGSRLMEHFIPEQDSVNVDRLKKAGAIVLGKTNTSELASKGMTDNLLFGVTRNPWNLERTTGGSSGGSAAAVAAGIAPIATGSDAGGSIRNPASCCGVFGIKPQFGRIPNYPIFNLWITLLHEGAITRTVKDAAVMLDVMSGPHWGDRQSIPLSGSSFLESFKDGIKGLRIAWSPGLGYSKVRQEIRTICENAVKKFSELGAYVEEKRLDCTSSDNIYLTIMNAELSARLLTFGPMDKIKDKLDPWLVERIKPVQNLTAQEYLEGQFARQELADRIGQFFENYDLLLTPTLGLAAWPLDLATIYPAEIDGKPLPTKIGWQLTFPFNLTGQPAASMPIGWAKDGMPVGLQLVSKQHDEATIFRAAAAFEEASPWINKKPEL